jgi:hypothetical protein
MLLTLGEVFDEEAFCMDTILYDVLRQPLVGEVWVRAIGVF